jgi:putative glutathione S-transferase
MTEKPTSTLHDVAKDPAQGVPVGSFQRKATIFRNSIAKGGPFPPAAGRYLLYVSFACPWACRCLALRTIKGLQSVIDVAVVSPVWVQTRPGVDDHWGWAFDEKYPGATTDPVFGAKTMREFYDKATEGLESKAERFTVPVLFDKETKRIVNNESSEIIRFLNVEFDDFVAPEKKSPHVDMYPEKFRQVIDSLNESFYESVNNGVYKCGFAQTQEAYNFAVGPLFKRLDELDDLLSKQRFLVKGAGLTEADIRLFVTLVRFDPVYYVHFKCSKKLIREYKNLSGWLKDVYQTGSLESSVQMKHIVDHYYISHTEINRFSIVPVFQDSGLDQPHDRASLPL